MHKKYVTSAVLAIALLAGCGGSDSKESKASEAPAAASDAPKAETTDAPDTTPEADTSAPADSTADSAEDTFPPLDTSAPVDTDFSGEGSGDFCGLLTDLEEGDDPSDSIGDPTADPEAVKAEFEQFNAIFGELQDKAPDEIKGDVEIMGKVFASLNDFYAKYDYDADKFTTALTEDPAVLDLYTSTLGELGDVDAASTRLDAYSTNVCGILSS
jgi:hypothetical protein